ncbi:MAG: L,D-transpeptidase family protein [Gammaproteobacteria bacterium]|nr:L,D-transpeptidase family protein [Gammaproteobacteria bacterium]
MKPLLRHGALILIGAYGLLSAAIAAVPPAGDPDWHIEISPASSNADTAAGRATAQRHLVRSALQRYQEIVESGGWPALADGPALTIGMRDARVPMLRQRLRLTQDFRAEVQADRLFFDSALAQALQHYQIRNDLRPTGQLDARTRESLNVPARVRAAQLAASLQRWHWLPAELENRYVWVNIAAAQLQLVENDREILRMRTVVGHPTRPTPSLRSEITSVVIHPDWVVPPTIAGEDILPRQQADPGYLDRKHIAVYDNWSADARRIQPGNINWQKLRARDFPYRLVQAPGPWNSLGQIKLQMSNEHGIYLHDTNAAYLLSLSVRAFSSGCVRLENARQLAEHLLAHEDKMAVERLAEKLAEVNTGYLMLAEPVPIYIVYLTAWVDTATDAVHFRRDIYQRDSRLAAALRNPAAS